MQERVFKMKGDLRKLLNISTKRTIKPRNFSQLSNAILLFKLD